MKHKPRAKSASTVASSKQNAKTKYARPRHFSPAAMKIAKKYLEDFEAQTDEAFLIRAEMDRRLSSL